MKFTYEGFPHRADELSAYIYGAGVFVLSLRSGEVIHHEPEDTDAFRNWLQYHRIRDVAATLPPHIYKVLIAHKK